MGAIRDSFKKFLGFDVEERQEKETLYKTIQDNDHLQNQEEFENTTIGENLNKDSNHQPFNRIRAVRKTNNEYTTTNMERLDTRTNNSDKEKSIFEKSTIKYEKPKTYGDACKIVEYLLEGYTVYVDVVDVEHKKARRIVDFIDGAIYAAGGDREIIKHKYFKFSPTYEEDDQLSNSAFSAPLN